MNTRFIYISGFLGVGPNANAQNYKAPLRTSPTIREQKLLGHLPSFPENCEVASCTAAGLGTPAILAAPL